ncbi:MAG: XRE family transcriptional regulator [Treponemataceae bacterium]
MRYRFGEKIREVRDRRGLTLKAVAEVAGVSESLVSQIERNRVSPAIDTLLALADALDIDLEYLFADFKKERAVKIVRKDARSTSGRPGVLYERLARMEGEGTGRFGLDSYLITLDVGAKTGHGEYGHPGFELGLVTEGVAELDVGTKIHRLEEGDSASFLADVPHTIKNAGDTPLKMFWVVTPPRS